MLGTGAVDIILLQLLYEYNYSSLPPLRFRDLQSLNYCISSTPKKASLRLHDAFQRRPGPPRR